MNEFIRYILSETGSAAQLACVATAVVLVISLLCFLLQKRRGGSGAFPWKRLIGPVLLAGYLVMLVYAVFLRSGLVSLAWEDFSSFGALLSGQINYLSGVNLHLFRAFREAWGLFTWRSWLNLLLNVALFLPLGVLLPLLFRPMERWYIMLGTAFGTSLFIELVQFATNLGTFDVDDLAANTLGGMLGFCLVQLVRSLIRGRGTVKTGQFSLLPLLSLLTVAGTLLVYQLQPYGNLSIAPAYRVNTSNITFSAACALSDAAVTAPVYISQEEPDSQTEQDAFAADFFQLLGLSAPDDVMYYDDESYYADHAGGNFLSLSTHDQSYFFWHSSFDEQEQTPATLTRSELVARLADLGITVPEEAALTQEEDGSYCFTVHQLPQGEYLLDGDLRCSFGTDGTLYSLDNTLLSYVLVAEEPILSPAAAYQKLCQGQFQDRRLEIYTPSAVEVTSVELTYCTDTKGYRQPVYCFSLRYGIGDEIEEEVLVPALA
jgi:glycopeptide antibiotics resistance protein